MVQTEMEEVREATIKDQERGQASYVECFSTKDRILWRTMIGICVQIGQQITGINFFFSYGVQFAQTAGLDDTYVFQIILASVNVVFSFPGILAVDRAGRDLSSSLVAFSCLLVRLLSVLSPRPTLMTRLPVMFSLPSPVFSLPLSRLLGVPLPGLSAVRLSPLGCLLGVSPSVPVPTGSSTSSSPLPLLRFRPESVLVSLLFGPVVSLSLSLLPSSAFP